MTDKELRKLSREDLLQLLISSAQEIRSLEEQLAESKYNEKRQFDSNERLRDKLNDREETIENLKEKLNSKDEKLRDKDSKLDSKDLQIADLKSQIKYLQENGLAVDESGIISAKQAGSIADAALAINGIFEAAQRAADQYLASVKRMAEGENE